MINTLERAKVSVMQTKVCNGCNTEKPIAKFYVRHNRKGGTQNKCKDCQNAYNRARHKIVGRRYSTEYRRKWQITKYGLTVEQYEAMLMLQGGVCAICANPDPYSDVLSIDHDEQTNKVRGLLCGNCNRAIGLLKHQEVRLAAALAYLRRHNARD